MPISSRFFASLALFVAVLLGGRPATAQTSDSTALGGTARDSAATGSTGNAALALADSLWLAGQFEASLEALQTGPDSARADVLWRMARAKGNLGENAEDNDQKATWYRAALENAQAAVEADSANAEAWVTQAIAAGRVGLEAGNKEKVELSREVKESVDRAIELDPENTLAYHVRGRWNYEVASLGFFSRAALKLAYGGLPDASYESAVEDFKQAIALEDQVVHHLELGKTYQKLDDASRAKDEFERALALETTYPDDARYKEEAEERLAELE